jgi:tripartite-type tricarboxylate transporter receptor subunit TctC
MTWKPEREVETTPPGGGLDRAARALARAIEANKLIDVPVKVVNVGGDGGRRAWTHVDRCPATARDRDQLAEYRRTT